MVSSRCSTLPSDAKPTCDEHDQKASLEALFWSTFPAALYHAVGAVSEGHPFAIVAMALCICGSKPLLNLTTSVLGPCAQTPQPGPGTHQGSHPQIGFFGNKL